jgi:parvulin-like peptidyl-prolyl isomerase
MIAKQRGRRIAWALIALGAVGGFRTQTAWAQKARAKNPAPPARATTEETAPPPQSPPNGPYLKPVALPANPDDPVAIINGKPITRRQLADECVARRGKEILDTLIARELIEQALHAKKLDVTAAEIDAEIEKTARNMAGLGREAWLRALEEKKGISPIQYARDIIYPTIALRKLAAPSVQVTAQDLKDAFEAQFGERLRVRVIMTDKLRAAQEIWEELKANPGGFEKLAQTRSIDASSASLGGLIGQPITRHASPREFSDAVFRQLVDGDPADKDPKHKPKDGDFTGPIQVSELAWAIVRREGLIPAQNADPNDPKVKAALREMMFDAKVQAKMSEVMAELYKAAAIENKLTGQSKLAHEELHPASQLDGQVELMSNPAGSTPGATAPAQRSTVPAGLSPETIQGAQKVKKGLQSPN